MLFLLTYTKDKAYHCSKNQKNKNKNLIMNIREKKKTFEEQRKKNY